MFSFQKKDMKPSKTIKYKALFLLVTFSLNSVVGFACSLGFDMGFNSNHHDHDSGNHHENSDADNHHEHDGNNSHSHQHGAKSDHNSSGKQNNTASYTSQSEDNCCKDFVVGFQNMDKMVAKGCGGVQQQNVVISPFVIPLILELNNTKRLIKHFRDLPKEIDLPPPDIIVFVQSFLI